MRIIRENVFETNSSSMHAIVVSRINNYNIKKLYKCPITFDLGMDFSERKLIERKSANEKASYLFHLICDRACRVMPSHTKKKEYTDNEIMAVKKYYEIFVNILNKTKEHYKNEGIIIDFKNYDLNINKEYGHSYIAPKEGWTSTGCYGHESLIDALYMDNIFDSIIQEQIGEKEISESSNYWWGMDEILNFILSDTSVILQGSDEMDDSEIEKQKKLVIKYAKKNKGDMSVIWPLGG